MSENSRYPWEGDVGGELVRLCGTTNLQIPVPQRCQLRVLGCECVYLCRRFEDFLDQMTQNVRGGILFSAGSKVDVVVGLPGEFLLIEGQST